MKETPNRKTPYFRRLEVRNDNTGKLAAYKKSSSASDVLVTRSVNGSVGFPVAGATGLLGSTLLLQYFDDSLQIVFDNDRTVREFRSFDTTFSEFLAE